MSFVAMEHKQCPVCLEVHTHNCSVLLNKKMQDIEQDPVTGWGMCEEHDKLSKTHAALICLTEKGSHSNPQTMEDSLKYRTGDAVHITYELLHEMFETGETMYGKNTIIFIDEGVFSHMKSLEKVCNEN